MQECEEITFFYAYIEFIFLSEKCTKGKGSAEKVDFTLTQQT